MRSASDAQMKITCNHMVPWAAGAQEQQACLKVQPVKLTCRMEDQWTAACPKWIADPTGKAKLACKHQLMRAN